MRTMIAIQIGMVAAALSLAGCDDAKQDTAKKPTAATPSEASGKAGEPAKDGSAGQGLAAKGEIAGGSEDDLLEGIDRRVMRAATVAKKIEAEPEKAGDILDAAGLQRDEFEDLIFEISADATLAKQYQAAMVAQTG